MSVVYLNGEYIAPEAARISPMDRGFLFGDGIYEVIPSYAGKFLGFALHAARLYDGLSALQIPLEYSVNDLKAISERLIAQHEGESLAVYIQISRGASAVRQHGFEVDMKPTVFIYAFPIPPPPCANAPGRGYRVNTQQDKRWANRHIKSTALLGNVLHYQDAKAQGFDETLLFNGQQELTEAAACNVFIVKDGVIYTPELDQQKLPGITRAMIISMVHQYSDIPLKEQVVTKSQVMDADEVWVTSSSKQLAWVAQIDDKELPPVGPNSIWYQVQSLFTKHQFDFN